MTEKGWSNTGMPQRMKEELKAKRCSRCGSSEHSTRGHDKAKRAVIAQQPVSKQIPIAPFRKRVIKQRITTEKKGKLHFSLKEMGVVKPALTNRARRMAKKCFPKKPHNWRFSLLTEIKHEPQAQAS